MTKRELMDMLENIATEVRTNLSKNMLINSDATGAKALLSQDIVDAVLVQFFNEVGLYQGLDEGFSLKYLRKE